MHALQQVFPTVVGDVDSSGSLNAQLLLLLAERLRAKAVFQVTRGPASIRWSGPPSPPRVSCSGGSRERSRGDSDRKAGGRSHSVFSLLQTQQAKFLTWQFDGEYRGDDYTATLTLGNPDLIGESGEELGQGPFSPGCSLANVGSACPSSVQFRG